MQGKVHIYPCKGYLIVCIICIMQTMLPVSTWPAIVGHLLTGRPFAQHGSIVCRGYSLCIWVLCG